MFQSTGRKDDRLFCQFALSFLLLIALAVGFLSTFA